MYLLSIFKGTCFPSREGSHILVNESSTCSSLSFITLKLVPSILQRNRPLHLQVSYYLKIIPKYHVILQIKLGLIAIVIVDKNMFVSRKL